MKVLVTMKQGYLLDSFIDADTRALLEETFDVSFNELDREFTENDLDGVLAEGYDILLTGWGTPFLSPYADRFSLLAHTGGSVGDLVDGDAYAKGLRVISANSIYARSTAEGALSYILSALREIPDLTSRMRESGYWKKDGQYDTRSLGGKTVGVIGVGSVARNLIELLKPFGVNLKLYDDYGIDPDYLRRVGAVAATLDEVLSTCDVITLHAALTEKTYHMIGKRELSMIRDGALFVNTSRGAVVDEAALVEALSEKRFNAHLDVFEREPLEDSSPLRKLDNVYLTPHTAGPANDLYPYIGKEIVLDMIRFKKGDPLSYEISREQADRMTRHSAAAR
ncbi:MAG: hydroxyacid dehydrogenase [Clostridia bacterium]|nr:hydroxyacid dehydrogenase [Clostridia bacterium]